MVHLYAIVANPTDAKFSGQVQFTEGPTDIGSMSVSLAPGATQTASVLWKPAAGNHTIEATLKADDGTVAQKTSQTFSVKAPPPPQTPEVPGANSAAVESSQAIQTQISNVSPQVGAAVAPAFNFVDGVRQSIAQATDNQIAQVEPKIVPVPLPGSTGSPQSGQVEGAQTQAPSGTGGWIQAVGYTLYFYVLVLVRFVVGSAAVFYPVVAVAFLWFMWRMFSRFRRV